MGRDPKVGHTAALLSCSFVASLLRDFRMDVFMEVAQLLSRCGVTISYHKFNNIFTSHNRKLAGIFIFIGQNLVLWNKLGW